MSCIAMRASTTQGGYGQPNIARKGTKGTLAIPMFAKGAGNPTRFAAGCRNTARIAKDRRCWTSSESEKNLNQTAESAVSAKSRQKKRGKKSACIAAESTTTPAHQTPAVRSAAIHGRCWPIPDGCTTTEKHQKRCWINTKRSGKRN